MLRLPLQLILLLLLVIMADVYGQTAPAPGSEIYHRMQRVWYQRRLGIDSAKAMQLVKADEAEQEGTRAIYENNSLDISGRAKSLKILKDEHERRLKALLTPDELSRLSRNTLAEGKRTMVIQPAKVDRDSSWSSRQQQIQRKYQQQLRALMQDQKLDSKLRQEKVKGLVEAQQQEFTELHKERERQKASIDSIYQRSLRERAEGIKRTQKSPKK